MWVLAYFFFILDHRGFRSRSRQGEGPLFQFFQHLRRLVSACLAFVCGRYMPMCFLTDVSAYRCIPVPMYPRTDVSPYLRVSIPMCLRTVPMCPRTYVSPYRCVSVPYRCVPVPMFPRTDVSQHQSVPNPNFTLALLWP